MPSDQFVQSCFLLGLENQQGWRLHILSGQPATLSGYPQMKKSFPYIHSKPLFFQLMSAGPCPLALHHFEEPDPISLMIPFTPHPLPGTGRLLSGLPEADSSPRLNLRWSLSLSSWSKCSSPDYPGGPPLNLLQYTDVFLVLGGPKLDTIPR